MGNDYAGMAPEPRARPPRGGRPERRRPDRDLDQRDRGRSSLARVADAEPTRAATRDQDADGLPEM